MSRVGLSGGKRGEAVNVWRNRRSNSMRVRGSAAECMTISAEMYMYVPYDAAICTDGSEGGTSSSMQCRRGIDIAEAARQFQDDRQRDYGAHRSRVHQEVEESPILNEES
jgi:hypothetical protein